MGALLTGIIAFFVVVARAATLQRDGRYTGTPPVLLVPLLFAMIGIGLSAEPAPSPTSSRPPWWCCASLHWRNRISMQHHGTEHCDPTRQPTSCAPIRRGQEGRAHRINRSEFEPPPVEASPTGTPATSDRGVVLAAPNHTEKPLSPVSRSTVHEPIDGPAGRCAVNPFTPQACPPWSVARRSAQRR